MPTTSPTLLRRGLLVAGIVLIALNLRPALAGVGPLVESIRASTGLSSTALGFLTTLPLLAFGVVSMMTPLVTRRLGLEGALAAALGMIGIGTAVRLAPSTGLLFAGTLLLGIGIALGNVLLPTMVKRDFPDRSGSMTSLYSSVMALGAALGAGVSVPLATELGWRGSLAVWALPAGVALAVWAPQLRGTLRTRPRRAVGSSLRTLSRSPLAWGIALFMGLQSLTFYVLLAWLPDILQSRGLSEVDAGGLLALSQATGIVGSAIVPAIATRWKDQRWLVGGLAVLEAIGVAGLFLPGGELAALWVSLLGVVLGGTFGLALLLLVLRAVDAEMTTQLSGMAQSIGYLVAAAGPAGIGYVYDVSSSWTGPLVILMGVLALKTIVGIGVGRPTQITRPE